ncbi:unnamed protein product [Rotaria magnacalcarata]|uniref:Uncharacterized protein n=1 Tax=Rotaria magnacalcarata TaxID=392030 RepID=A0A820NPS3_9BILA|nr:unnamed protein product [Rotaria magnacalcarata]
MFCNDNNKQIKMLTNLLVDKSSSEIERREFRRQRILINYEEKKYKDVLHDINIIEQTENISGLLLVLKLKPMIQEQFQKARSILMEQINNGGKILIRSDSSDKIVSLYTDNSDDCEALFLNLRQDRVEQLMNGDLINKHDPTAKPNKRRKII